MWVVGAMREMGRSCEAGARPPANRTLGLGTGGKPALERYRHERWHVFLESCVYTLTIFTLVNAQTES